MYNESVPKLSLIQIFTKLSRKYPAITIAIIALLFFLFGALYLHQFKLSNKTQQVPDMQAGIAFETFWQRLQQESGSFLQGTVLYIADIESVNVANFAKKEGRAGLWVATIVRCGQFLGSAEASASGQPVCIGDSAKVSMADASLTGMASTLTVTIDELPYSGSVIKANDLVVGATQAEAIANKSRSYKINGMEDYYYRLTIEADSARPVWHISKSCANSKQNNCDISLDWSQGIDASTGELL